MKNTKILIIISIVTIVLLALYFYLKNEKVYTLNKYSPEGKLLGTNEYVIRNGDTIFHGKAIEYNEKGNKIAEGQFVDDYLKGKCIFYYDNGKVETIQFTNGKITEESFYYDQNGSLESYKMYNALGKTTFTINFDKKGVTKYEGNPVFELYEYSLTDKAKYNIKVDQVFKVGDTLKCKYLVANIPNTKRTFKIQNISVDNEKVKRTITKKPSTGINVEEVLTKKGVNTIRAIFEYKFNDKVTPTLTDTLSFKVTVN